MAEDINYRGYIEEITVGFLKGYWGSRLLYTGGVVIDAVMEGVRSATRARFLDDPNFVPVDALPYAGADSNLDRYPPDTDISFLARLRARWEAWGDAGNELSILAQLHAFGFPNVTVYPAREIDPPYPYDDDAHWSRFFIVIDQPHGYEWPQWGSMTWGSFTWGFVNVATGLSIDLATALQRLVQKFRDAEEVCAEIVLVGDTDTPVWGHNMTWGSFTWGTGTNGLGVARIPGSP